MANPITAGAAAVKQAAAATATAAKNTKLWKQHGKDIKTMLNEWVGPLGLSIALSFKFLAGIKGVLVASQLVGRSLEAWGRVQYYTPSFAKLLGGMGQAKARLGELVRMSASGPFKFDSLVQANRRLEILTRGMYSGRKAMEAVQDAAAAAGTSPEVAADAIGGARQAITNHEGEDGAIRALGEMGIVSVAAADSLRNLARAGAGEQQMLAALDSALLRNKGAAAALGDTLHGLSQQMAGVGNANLAQIGSLFESGSAAGMKAGLIILKEYGPVLVSLMKPLAALYNAWNQLLLTLAKLAAWEPIKQTMKGLAAMLGILATAFAIKGVQILVRDMAQLAGWLIKLAVPALKAAGGMRLVAGAGMFLGRSLMAALGPIGLLAMALTALAETFQMFGGDAGGALGKGIADSVNEIKEANDEVGKVVAAAKAGGDIGAKGEAVGAAASALDAARKDRRKQAGRTSGGGLLGLAADMGSYGAMGAGLGRLLGPVGAAVGGIAGLGVGAYMNQRRVAADEQGKKDSAAEEARAQRNYDEAVKARALTPSEYMNDPDYARAKAAGDEKLKVLQGDMAENRRKRAAVIDGGGSEDSPYIKSLDEAFKGMAQSAKDISAGVSPEALAKAFNVRMANTGTQATMMRSIGEATGDKSKMIEADRIEAKMREEARKKELQGLGIGEERAGKMARAEGLAGLAETLRNNGQVFASGRSSVGMAVGESAGGVPPEFRAVIEEIKKIQEELGSGNEGAQQERVRTVMDDA
jgi:hypothetical protein